MHIDKKVHRALSCWFFHDMDQTNSSSLSHAATPSHDIAIIVSTNFQIFQDSLLFKQSPALINASVLRSVYHDIIKPVPPC